MVREGREAGISDREIIERLTRIEMRLDTLVENLQAVGIQYNEQFTRITALETWRTQIKERVALIAAGFGLLASMLVRFGGSAIRFLSGGTP